MRKKGAGAALLAILLCACGCSDEAATVRSMTDADGAEIYLDAGSEELTEEYRAQERLFREAIEKKLDTEELNIAFCHLGNNAAYMTGEFTWEGTAYCATWRDGEIISWAEAEPLAGSVNERETLEKRGGV